MRARGATPVIEPVSDMKASYGSKVHGSARIQIEYAGPHDRAGVAASPAAKLPDIVKDSAAPPARRASVPVVDSLHPLAWDELMDSSRVV